MQGIPLTGDGGAATIWGIIAVVADAINVAAYAANIAATVEAGVAATDYTNLAQDQAEQYSDLATANLAQLTMEAMESAYSLANAAAIKANIAAESAAVVEQWQIEAQLQANAVGDQAHPLIIDPPGPGHLNTQAAQGSIYLEIPGNFDLNAINANTPEGLISVEATGNITVDGTISARPFWPRRAGISTRATARWTRRTSWPRPGRTSARRAIRSSRRSVPSPPTPAPKVAGGVFITNDGAMDIAQLTDANGTTVNGVTATSDVTITNDSSITFEEYVSSPGNTVTLNATAGGILNDYSGTDVTATTLIADATSGISVSTDVDNLTAWNSGTGAITVNNVGAITLTDVDSSVGPITITAGGTITATDVESDNPSAVNSTSLTATGGGSIVVAEILAGSDGDGDVLTLTANTGSGTITTLLGGVVEADNLTATAAAGISVTTEVSTADLSVTGTGNINVSEFDAITLSDVQTANGSITVIAGGTITATDVRFGNRRQRKQHLPDGRGRREHYGRHGQRRHHQRRRDPHRQHRFRRDHHLRRRPGHRQRADRHRRHRDHPDQQGHRRRAGHDGNGQHQPDRI